MTPLLLLLTGCITVVRFPPPQEWDISDTADQPVEPVHVTAATVACDPTTGTWLWEAETDGWTRAVVLDAADTTDALGWEEQHDLRLVDSHPEGRWDRLALGPIPGATPVEEWEPNVNTAFDCSTDRSKLTFAIRVWNHTGELTDCIVWGHDTVELVSRLAIDPEVAALGSCLVLSTNTSGSSP